MTTAEFEADLARIDPDVVPRVRMTVSCGDTDSIAKVDGAGEVFQRDGRTLQRMHNGVLIEEGCYFGPWMTVIIKHLRGHHEPQEEIVFDQIVRRLVNERMSGEAALPPVMIEFGSFWSYYSMWFTAAIPDGRAVAMEPDPAYLDVGKRNAALNGLSERITFLHGAVGAHPGASMEFTAESDGKSYSVATHDLASLMAANGVELVDLVLSDIQGAETILLERARGDLNAGRVRYLIVSTHHHTISGDPLTHQRVRDLLADAGAHVIAEHTVSESFSGDGLIAVSFDERDAGFTVDVSHARARDSLFGEAEPELNHWMTTARAAEEAARDTAAELAATATELAAARAEVARLNAQLSAVYDTKLWRWSNVPRSVLTRLRERRPGSG